MKFGERRVVARPEGFFGDKMPKQATLELCAPSGYGEELHDMLRRRIVEVEQEVRGSTKAPMGMRAVLRRGWATSPNTRAPRRQLIPRFAAARAAVRVAALVEFRQWQDAYREVWARFVAGDREVEWPMGTCRMAMLGCPTVAES